MSFFLFVTIFTLIPRKKIFKPVFSSVCTEVSITFKSPSNYFYLHNYEFGFSVCVHARVCFVDQFAQFLCYYNQIRILEKISRHKTQISLFPGNSVQEDGILYLPPELILTFSFLVEFHFG